MCTTDDTAPVPRPTGMIAGGTEPTALGDMPANVAQTVGFLTERGVWFRLSRNAEARSCRDAARKRHRLGHVGIPVRDEMKSFFGQVTVGGERRLIAAHCRGDRLLDLERLAAAIGADDLPHRLLLHEIDELDAAYGLVNPFHPIDQHGFDGVVLTTSVLQVFDRDLLEPIGLPGTVMTNAGELTWAVELHAEQLAAAIPGAVIGDITVRGHYEPERPPPSQLRGIGIITGNTPDAGMALWETINAAVRRLLADQFLGDVSLPHTVVDSLPGMGLSMELDDRGDEVWPIMAASVDRLCAAGVGLIAIACNTTQYFVPRLRERAAAHDVDVMSMPDAVAAWLRTHEVEQFGLVGIPFVSDLGEWSAYGEAFDGFGVETPRPRGMERLVELAYRVKVEGPNEGGLNQLRDILRSEIRSDHVVLAMTELSVLLRLQRRKSRSGKVLIDPLALYGEAVASRWLDRPFPAVEPRHALCITSASETGARETNQDAMVLGDGVAFEALDRPAQRQLDVTGAVTVAVADGLGGHRDAAFASQFVARRLRAMADRLLTHDDIVDALLQIHDAVVAGAVGRRHTPTVEALRASSTVAGIAFGPGASWAFNVGDSRIHRLAPGPVTQISTDHVGVGGRLRQALGFEYSDPGILDLGHPDPALYLICTDGLRIADAATSDQAALTEMVEGYDVTDASPADDLRLLDRILARSRQLWGDADQADDLSVILVRIIDLTR